MLRRPRHLPRRACARSPSLLPSQSRIRRPRKKELCGVIKQQLILRLDGNTNPAPAPLQQSSAVSQLATAHMLGLRQQSAHRELAEKRAQELRERTQILQALELRVLVRGTGYRAIEVALDGLYRFAADYQDCTHLIRKLSSTRAYQGTNPVDCGLTQFRA